jgi:hypothetical protein
MKRSAVLLAAIVSCLLSSALADYGVTTRGEWPATWPEELDSLRANALTLEGPMCATQHYAIRFTDREEFEAAWPHLLTVKRAGARLVLKRGKNFFLGEDYSAGVVVHVPEGSDEQDASIECVELVVNGDIIDLNRIQLPKDTPICDERFDK